MVPRKVHVCWPNREILRSESPLVLNGLRNMVDMNPEWEVILYEDRDVERELESYLGRDDYRALLAGCRFVEKSDLWRLYKMHLEGGIYVDVDRFCNVPLSDVVGDAMCVLPTCADLDFSQDIMVTAAGNPIHRRAIEMVLERRARGFRSTYFLGPQTYMHAVTTELVGYQLDTNPGREKFDEVRAKLAEMPFIRTYREHPPYDTVLYRHDPSKFVTGPDGITDWETLKRRLYAEHGLRHWSGEW